MNTKKKLTALTVSELSTISMNSLKGGAGAVGGAGSLLSYKEKIHYTSSGCGDHYYDVYDDQGRFVSFYGLIMYPC